MSAIDASRVRGRRECADAKRDPYDQTIAPEDCYHVLFERHPQPMAIYEPASLRFCDVNDAAIALYGYTRAEFLAMTAPELSLWPDAARIDLSSGETALLKHVRRDRTPIDVEISVREVPQSDSPQSILPLRLLVIRDQTERLRVETERRILEAQFHHAQKLEPVRSLAGGIAHDFNNLLTILLGYSDWLETREGIEPQFAAAAHEIHQASESASVLVRQLLAFSRREAVRPRIVNVNEAITNMHQMLRRMIGEDIELRTVTAARLATITIDPGLLEQVVLNLAVNARDAMPEGGVLRFETHTVVRDDGAYVRLSVRDNGQGMSDDVRRRVFEPFFSTKAAGKGTGLGLAAVYGIVNQHRGTIVVESSEGAGTCFEIDLPYTPPQPEPPKDEAPPMLRVAGGNEWVLVVEDDARLRSLAEQILATRGYQVIGAANAREALALIETHGDRLSLLLSDIVMPGVNGRELANLALKSCPWLSVIYMSGYTDAVGVNDGRNTPEAFLGKPFTAVGLLELVRSTLDNARPRSEINR